MPEDWPTFESASALRDHQQAVGVFPNLRRYGIHPAVFITGLPTMVFLLGLTCRWLGVETFLTRSPHTAVFSADVLVLFFLIHFGETRFLPVLEQMRPSFEMDDTDFYTFFGRLADKLYVSLPFTPHSFENRLYLLSRAVLVVSITAMLGAAVAVAWTPLSGLGLVSSVLYLIFLGTMVVLSGFAIYAGIWWGGVVALYMGVKVADCQIRLDITRTSDNLGLRPYGIHVLKISAIVSVGLAIAAWTLVSRFNLFSLVLVGAGIVVLPTLFVGSQYGLHRAIQHSKDRRLQDLRGTYTDDLDRWFSDRPVEQQPASDLEEQVRVHSMIMTKREIEALPEWPTKARDFAQVILLGLAYNFGVVVNLVG